MDKVEMSQLVNELEAIRQRCEELSQRRPIGWEDLPEYRSLQSRAKALERKIALVRGEEAALLCPWDIEWLPWSHPRLLRSIHRTFLIYEIDQRSPDERPEDYIARINRLPERGVQAEPAEHLFCVAELAGCYVVSAGGPNDEVLEGHRLSNRGLDGYGAYIVENSAWKAELMSINAVHSVYDSSAWQQFKHYLLVFKDELIEFLAKDVTLSRSQEPEGLLLQRLVANLRG